MTADSDRPTSSGLTLWLDPGFGASGDMMLGTLIGLGAPIEAIRSGLDKLGVDGWSLDSEPTLRCSLSATRALVQTDEDNLGDSPDHDHDTDHGHDADHDHDSSHSTGHGHAAHRSWSSIDALLAGAGLSARVESGSRATFRRLGEVEAGIHGIDIDQVRFHEVGAVDAIVDIVGAWLALDALNIERVICGPVGVGHGTVEAAHGRLPIPAPATADLLAGAAIQPIDVAAETITPTGAALLVTMADGWGSIPTGQLVRSARGAGGRDPEHYPNVLTGYLVDSSDQPARPNTESGPATETGPTTETGGPSPAAARQVEAVVLTTNLDDATPEVVGHTINRCLAAGADDAWAAPIIMKKGRPGVELKVLCSPDLAARLRQLLFAETGTLGVRMGPVDKFMLDRSFTEVTVRGHTIVIKVGPFGAKPEYEDLAAASEALDVPVRTLATEALEAYAAQTDGRHFPT